MAKTAKVFPWKGDGPGDPITYVDVTDAETEDAVFVISHNGGSDAAIWPIDSVHHIDMKE